MNKLNYIITDRAISITINNKRRIVPSDSYVYKVLLQQIKTGSVDLNKKVNFKDFVLDSIYTGSNVYGLSDKINKMTESGIPAKPFIKMLSAIPESVLTQNPEILTKAGTKELPLTYSGKIIGYQRSSFLPKGHEQGKSWVSCFEPGTILEGAQLVSDFEYIKSRCPDMGSVYQVLINPEHIIGYDQHGFTVSKATQLNMLGKTITEAEKPQAQILHIKKKGQTLSIYIPEKGEDLLELLEDTDPFS